LVAAQVVDVDVVELVREGESNAGGGIAVKPAAVGDEADDPAVW